MIKYAILVLSLVLAGILTGCAAPQWGSSLPESRPLGAVFPTYAPQETDFFRTSNGNHSAAIEPTSPLNLRQAMALALLHNPELASFAWSVRQSEAEQLQASLLPNPELEAEFENFAGSGKFQDSRSLETTIGIIQPIELGGKRAKRMKLAKLDSKLAGWNYESKRLDVLTDVARRFIRVLDNIERTFHHKTKLG